jgi:hypothetical protein
VLSEANQREDENGVVVINASPYAWFITLGRVPGTQAWPPGRHCSPVGLVVRAEPAGEGGFLVEADERRDDQPSPRSVQ